MILSYPDLKYLLGTVFVIHPFDLSKLTTLGYDLRIGAILTQEKNSGFGGKLEWIKGESKVSVQAGYSAVIVVQEYVWLSRLVASTIHARGSLSLKGLCLNPTTVDPNFSGRMIFRIYNISKDSVELEVGEAFGTMIIHWLRTPTRSRPTSAPKEHINKVFSAEVSAYLHNYISGNQSTISEFQRLIHLAELKLSLGHNFKIVRFLSHYSTPLLLFLATCGIVLAHLYGLTASIAPALILFLTVYARLTKETESIKSRISSRK